MKLFIVSICSSAACIKARMSDEAMPCASGLLRGRALEAARALAVKGAGNAASSVKRQASVSAPSRSLCGNARRGETVVCDILSSVVSACRSLDCTSEYRVLQREDASPQRHEGHKENFVLALCPLCLCGSCPSLRVAIDKS